MRGSIPLHRTNIELISQMYSTRTAITMSLRDLLDKLDDYAIFSYYLGDIKINKLMNSPLRSDDKNPSFAIFKGRNGGLMFKDHGTGDGGNAIDFIKLYRNINNRPDLEKELLRILRKVNPSQSYHIATHDYVTYHDMDFGIVRQPFTNVDKSYWKQFSISMSTLRLYQVFSIKYFLCNRIVRGIYKESNPMYAYKVNNRFKIYRPLASKYTKWRSNLTNWDVQGLSELPEEGGSILIITKSLKDVMVLHEMGFNAIAAASETTFVPEDILTTLKSKWKHILILYDRDETGMLNARKLSKKYGYDAFFIHKSFKAKDVSDAVRDNGFDKVKTWLTKVLSRYEDTMIQNVESKG